MQLISVPWLHLRRNDGRLQRRRHRGVDRRRRQLSLGLVTTTEQTLQEARASPVLGLLHRTQGASLQATEFTQQGRQLTGLADPAIKLLRQFFQRSRHLAWQRQGLQLGNQRSQRVADLVHAGFAALLGVEYGFFQARNQPGEAGVHVVAADDLAHFLHALVN
ncbi:MAG: hypothetical protein H5U33_27415, partial [Pseudomonas sp.]|nr:hypothetical protein [Pseudomonas sp.]